MEKHSQNFAVKTDRIFEMLIYLYFFKQHKEVN